MEQIYLSRRNLQTLRNKLDRTKAGDPSRCTIIKCDTAHPVYPQSMKEIAVTAVEDEDYYIDRPAGEVHTKDVPTPGF
jgi:hypothetical protein